MHCPQRKKGVSPILTHQWQGPYLVTKYLNDTVFRVQSKLKVVHRNWLWKYTGENPTWLLESPQKDAEEVIADDSHELDKQPELRRGRLRHQPHRFHY